MKNLHAMLITLIVIVSGLLIPIEPAQAIQPYVTTKCHYMYEGNELTTEHKELPGDVSCPPFPSHAELSEILTRNGIPQDDPIDPGVDCEIIRYVFTEY